MRKLLVASQKGGVGKTTTSINLAASTARAGARVLLLDADPLSSVSNSLRLSEHPGRQPLRAAGVDMPGALVANFVPGLDVLSPYEESGCPDEELEGLLALLASASLAECYDCLIVDTPPFLGASPGQLLSTCDEFVLVMRAEPMAARTLPAFLELVQRSRQSIKLRGILLTLPEGENPGGRWERELRGRFGTRVLSGVIPHDEAVSQAEMFGQIVCHASPDAAPSRAYHAVVESLSLAGDARRAQDQASGINALLVAAAALKQAAPPATPPSRKVKRPAPLVAAPAPRPERPAPVFAPPPHEHRPDLDALPEPVRRRLTPAAPPPVVAALSAALPGPAAPPVEEASPAPRRKPAPPPPQGGTSPVWMALVGVGVTVGVAVGLRFLQLPENVLPALAGVAVASAVIVLLRGGQTPAQPDAPPARGHRPGSDGSKRLSTLARSAKRGGRRMSEN